MSITTYNYGKYLHNGYGNDATNHDTVTENPSGGYILFPTGEKCYTISEYELNYTVKIDSNGYPYVCYNNGVSTFNDINNQNNKGFSIKSVKGSLVSDEWQVSDYLVSNTVTITCRLRLDSNLMQGVDNGEYCFLKFNSNLYGLYLNKKDDGWYFNNSVKIPDIMFNCYLCATITMFFGSFNYNGFAGDLRTLVEIDDLKFYTYSMYSTGNNESSTLITVYGNDAFYATDFDLTAYNRDSTNRENTTILVRPGYIYPTGTVSLKVRNSNDAEIIKYYKMSEPTERLKQSPEDNDSVSYILTNVYETTSLKENYEHTFNAYENIPPYYLAVMMESDNNGVLHNTCDTEIYEVYKSPYMLYKYTDSKIYAVMLSETEPEKYIRIRNYYAELVTVDDPNASHINVKLPNDIVRRLKKFPELSNEIIILDCDFEDGYATDKTDNYSFYDNSYGYDVNNNSWFSISDEMEFNDYHYDCNPDFSVPVLEQGSSGSSDSLTNPYQVWILAEGWDNLWFMFNDIFCIKLSKLGDYFIYSYVGNSYNKFDVFIDSPEKTKSTARFETSIEFSEYYGKIIKITENSDAIEIVGDIYA